MRNADVDRSRRELLTGRLGDVGGAEAHVVSLVVYARKSRVAAAMAEIGRLRGAEIHSSDKNGKFVVVLEAEGQPAIAELMGRVDRTEGVICSALVYQHAEPLAPDE